MIKPKTLNIDWLTKRTGDPFADIGGYVIQDLISRRQENDILKLIAYAADIFVNNWGAKVHPFFLNSSITQNAYKGQEKINKTLEYFKNLILETIPFEEGYCRILGEKTHLFVGGRNNHILSGSSTYLNFHHSFQTGTMLSKEAIIRMFFVPLGSIQLGSKIGLIHSNDTDLTKDFVIENISEHLNRVASRIATGINKHPSNFPESALFDFALEWIRDSNSNENTEINLYHFTNFGASPEIELYNFSSPLYDFLRKVQHRTTKQSWDKFAWSYFWNKNAQYIIDESVFESSSKKETLFINYEEYKSWKNLLYEKLLSNTSILPQMLSWVSKKRKPLNAKIINLYATKLLSMNAKTLEIIDRIAEYIMSDPSNLKRNIQSFRTPSKAYVFRNVLRRLAEKNLAEKNPKPLFSMEEYAIELVPDGTYWQEIRSLLLIAIYQKMHERQIWVDGEDLEIIEDEIGDGR